MRNPFDGFEFPSEREVNELTRRAKISITTNLKMTHDPKFRKIKLNAGRKTAEKRRQVPLEDYKPIMLEYWDSSHPRPPYFMQTIADRYGVKHGVIEKIIMNWHSTLSPTKYKQLRNRYERAYPDHRSEIMRETSKKKDLKTAGKNISLAKQTLTAEQALEIYERCKPYWKCEGAKAFKQQLAREYGVGYHKVHAASMGLGHPVFATVELTSGADEYKKKIGTFWFCSPAGVEYNFPDLEAFGTFLMKTEKGVNPTKQQAIRTAQNWTAVYEPNREYVKERRFWKGWRYKNIR